LRSGIVPAMGDHRAPAAHLAVMQDELVRKRGWLDARRFTELVGVTNLIPGLSARRRGGRCGHRRLYLSDRRPC
jgi:hypothetical protein